MAATPMPTTRVTLLARLRQDPTDQAAWGEFVERYGRHIYRWCREWKGHSHLPLRHRPGAGQRHQLKSVDCHSIPTS
jgi:hypothetical protein